MDINLKRLYFSLHPALKKEEEAIRAFCFSKRIHLTNDADNSKFKILAIEDHEINNKVLWLMLKKFGYQCKMAFDGEEALAKFKTNRFDLILSDIQMPKMTGIEFTQAIRNYEQERGDHSIIIGQSAYDRYAPEKECYEAGMDGIIGKPYEMDFLENLLEYFLIERKKNFI